MVMLKSTTFMTIWVTAVMILQAPAAPMVMKGLPSGFSTMLGLMEERGRFPGSGAFTLEGSEEKSSIWLFSTIPYSGTTTPEPKK